MRQMIKIEKNYLRIPVSMETSEKNMILKSGEEILYQCMAPLHTEEHPGEPAFYAELPVEQWKGMEAEILAEDCSDAAFVQADERIERRESLYPFIHFAPASGWINDPCGLCYYHGEYHLYFQHNMFSKGWNNMSWGHAVTKDLLHWEQKKEALLPDQYGAVFTGSAVINEQGMLGIPKDAMIVCYTSAGNRSLWSKGEQFDQRYAWSLDGDNFTKLEKAALPYIVYENRDGKMYRHEETGRWFMILFLEGHDYAVFVSENMEEWTMTQRFTCPVCWECPDLVPVRLKGSEEKKWVFWTPDGYYQVGEFDGSVFTPQQDYRQVYGNMMAYAAQTFANTGERILQIPWLRRAMPYPYPYNGIMGLPREMELIRQDGSYILALHPAEEIDRASVFTEKEHTAGRKACETDDREGALRWKIRNCGNHSFELNVCGFRMGWDSDRKCLDIGIHEFAQPQTIEDLDIIADRGIVEIGMNSDTIVYYLNADLKMQRGFSFEGNAEITAGVIR